MSSVSRPDKVGAHRRAETIREGMRSFVAATEAIAKAYEARDWVTLGYSTWDEYCLKEFAESQLKLNTSQREQAVLAFRGVGMSTRAIAKALGVSKGSVHRTLKPGAPIGARAASAEAASETMPVEVYRCEKCTKPLAEGIVKAAQRRCLGCDPNREHAAYEVGGPCMVCPKPCENCDGTVKATDVPAGHLRCRACDPTSLHRAVVVDGKFIGDCIECINQAAAAERLAAANPQTSAAVTADSTDGIVGIPVGEPDVDELAASTSGTPSSEENFSDGVDAQPRVDPVGSEPGYDGLGSGNPQTAAGPEVEVSPSPAVGPHGVRSAVRPEPTAAGTAVGSVPDGVGYWDVAVRDNPEERIEEEAASFSAPPLLAGVTPEDSPAADGSLPDGASPAPEQPGLISPTVGSDGGPRSEVDQQVAGVSPAGAAPALRDAALVEPVELEGGGLAADPSSSSDPDQPWESPAEQVVRLFKTFTDELDAVDYEAVGPELTEIDLYAIQQCDARIADHLERLEKFVRTP